MQEVQENHRCIVFIIFILHRNTEPLKRPLKRPPIHPGEILREDVLPSHGLSISDAARHLNISRQQLHRVLACPHPITTEMALRIGKFAGNGPGIWLRMQQARHSCLNTVVLSKVRTKLQFI